MAKVDEPKYDKYGELTGCHHCPLDSEEDDELCVMWWYRKGKSKDLKCPTADTYAAACELPEKEAQR